MQWLCVIKEKPPPAAEKIITHLNSALLASLKSCRHSNAHRCVTGGLRGWWRWTGCSGSTRKVSGHFKLETSADAHASRDNHTHGVPTRGVHSNFHSRSITRGDLQASAVVRKRSVTVYDAALGVDVVAYRVEYRYVCADTCVCMYVVRVLNACCFSQPIQRQHLKHLRCNLVVAFRGSLTQVLAPARVLGQGQARVLDWVWANAGDWNGCLLRNQIPVHLASHQHLATKTTQPARQRAQSMGGCFARLSCTPNRHPSRTVGNEIEAQSCSCRTSGTRRKCNVHSLVTVDDANDRDEPRALTPPVELVAPNST